MGKDQDITVKTKGAGGQGKVGAKVTAPSGKPVASKVREDPEFSFELHLKERLHVNSVLCRWSRA